MRRTGLLQEIRKMRFEEAYDDWAAMSLFYSLKSFGAESTKATTLSFPEFSVKITTTLFATTVYEKIVNIFDLKQPTSLQKLLMDFAFRRADLLSL